jgi:hypothetical protein
MTADDRAKLKRILASFDEAGLVALANKGLVRRAQKDLEAGGLASEEAEQAILVRGPDWTVIMPVGGPTQASDTTKATGVTRQILMATIYLRDHWLPSETTPVIATETPAPAPAGLAAAPPKGRKKKAAATQPPPVDEAETLRQSLLDLSIEDLEQWAGKTLLREAVFLVRSGMTVEVEKHAGLTIRLIGQEVEARVLPGPYGNSAAKLLDSILTTAPRSQQQRWVLVAVLAFQQSCGRSIELPEATVPAEVEGAPLSRAELLGNVAELLAGMVATGLAHPSQRMVERLFTLSISAGALNLPRLGRLLRALADDVSLVLSREAAADTDRLFDRLCFAHALSRALNVAQPGAVLRGRHRTQYDPAGDLELAGVGAFPWQTASGYEGITLLFWDTAGKRFLTWTTSRPTGNPGPFGMAQAYRHESVWSGGGSPEQLCRSRFTLKQARLNPLGRLSGAQSASVVDAVPADPSQLDFAGRLFANWIALRQYARSTYPLGLDEKNPLDRIVVLQPARWGERVFDELQQRLVWAVHDDQGAAIPLTLPWIGVNEAAIEFLEAVKPDRDELRFVVARLIQGPAGLQFEPLTLLGQGGPHGQRVLNPGFDRPLIASKQSTLLDKLRAKYGRDRIPTTMADDDGDADNDTTAMQANLPPGIQTRLSEVEGLLLQRAEAGMRRLNEATHKRLKDFATALNGLGLTELGQGLASLEETSSPEQLLRCGYLCRLHRQVAAAMAE